MCSKGLPEGLSTLCDNNVVRSLCLSYGAATIVAGTKKFLAENTMYSWNKGCKSHWRTCDRMVFGMNRQLRNPVPGSGWVWWALVMAFWILQVKEATTQEDGIMGSGLLFNGLPQRAASSCTYHNYIYQQSESGRRMHTDAALVVFRLLCYFATIKCVYYRIHFWEGLGGARIETEVLF